MIVGFWWTHIFRESGQTQPKIIRHSDVIQGKSNWFRIFKWHQNDGDEIKWQEWNQEIPYFHQTSEMTEWASDDWNCHSNITPVIRTDYHSPSFLCSNDYRMNGMMTKWRYIVIMNYDWWNDTGMIEWHLNDGMTSEWWNDIQMMEWHSNDETLSELGRDDGMT